MAFQGPSTRASGSVLNLVTPPIGKIIIEPTPAIPPSDPHVTLDGNGFDIGPGINMNQSPLYNLRTPLDGHDAANKDYVDATAGGTAVGMMIPWPSLDTNVPSGWLLCDGRTIGAPGTGATIESAALESLFDLIKFMAPNTGTEVWGVNTVQLPDMRGRFTVGKDDRLASPTIPSVVGREVDGEGKTGGDYEMTLTLSELPTHDHTISNTVSNAHDHTVAGVTLAPGASTIPEGGGAANATGAAHTHNFSVISGPPNDPSPPTDTGMTGSGTAFDILPPYLTINWIIRFGATGPSGGPVIDTLGDLLDVTLSSPQPNDVLVFNGSVWVNLPSSTIGGAGGGGVSVGSIIPYGGPVTSPPAGMLPCDGTVLLRAAYPDLFAILGTNFNTGGETITEFRLPDFRGRVPVGADPTNVTLVRAHDLGDYGGSETHVLTLSEMPAHDHGGGGAGSTGSGGAHSHGGGTGGGGTHTHTVSVADPLGGFQSACGNPELHLSGLGLVVCGNKTTSTSGSAHSHSISSDPGHTHSVSITINSQGNDQAHENMQPYVGINWLVAAEIPSAPPPVSLQGRTFLPTAQTLLVSNTHPTTGDTIVGPVFVDVSAGGSVVVPPNATHAVIRSEFDMNGADNNSHILRARKDGTETFVNKTVLDPVETSAGQWESRDWHTWIIEFDLGTKLFEYQYERSGGLPGSDTASVNLYLDGFYLEEANNVTNSLGGVPAGTILPWGGVGSPPAGFILCDGQQVAEATFPELFATIGTSYNTGGEVAGFFRVPDFTGRFPVGEGDSGTTGSTSLSLGDQGGEAEHQLTIAEMPSHDHGAGGSTGSAGSHSHGGGTAGGGSHTHGVPVVAFSPGSGTSGAEGTSGPNTTFQTDAGGSSHSHTISSDGSHTHTITVGLEGNDQTHENMPPFTTVKYMIAAVTGAGQTAAGGFLPGDVKPTVRPSADPGWILMDDGTIGSATSGATTRANADTEVLFTVLWDILALAVSGGRGASAAADFAANKTIEVPKALGRALVGADPGNAVLARSANLGETTGSETHVLTTLEMPSHNHPGSSATSGGSHTHPTVLDVILRQIGGPLGVQDVSTGAVQSSTAISAAGTHTHGLTIAAQGGDQPHENMQLSTFVNYLMKL